MLDHLLGKPSDNIRRLQVGGLLYLSYLVFFTKRQLLGGKLYDKINLKLVKYNPIQIIFLTLSTLYCLKNWLLFIGLGPPNSMAHMYNRNFFRASYLFIATVAGSLTARKLKPKILRDTFGLICMGYYLIFPNQAEERLRLEYRVVKAETMRVGWQVESNMWIKLGRYLLFPRCKIIRTIMIPRAKDSPHGDEPVEAMLLFDGTEEELRLSKSLIFHIPGGGFVCLNPECYASVTNPMGKQTKLPIISFNYKKAPEHPYPYALNQLFDAYRTICKTEGRCLGIDKLQTRSKVHNGVQFDEINIAITGDSAGGNLSASLTLLILESSQSSTDSYIVPRPKGLVLVYPVLDNNIEVWMSRDNIKQFRQQSVRDLQSLWNSKDHFSHQSPLATYDDTKKWGGIVQKSSLRDKAELSVAKKPSLHKSPSESHLHHIDPLKFPWVRNKQSPIAMGSKLAYFDDRILTGELFRALPIFYLGPNNDSDFINDYFISPLKAPDHLLAQFPKTYFVCGDRDPLVDDTILMAAKIKKAKQKWSKSIHRIRNRKGNEIQKPTPFTNQIALDKNFDGLVIGNDRSSLPNSAYNSSDSESDDDYASASEGESAFNIGSAAVPKQKKTVYNRLLTRVRSYVSILQQPPAIPKANSDHLSTAGKDEVHVKIINGVSHGFLNYADFLPEGKAAIKLNSNWLLDLLQEEESEEEEVNKAE